mmetsp:Transcript_601/g.716  ORF Transcript_601/g.716 Transcript_601/m.716 type:complete len:877 (+) Transcript_601:69-2699(+)
MSLTEILLKTQSPATREEAENLLKSAETNNFGSYVSELAKELANEGSTPQPRSLAGVLLKLSLTGQTEVNQRQKSERWMQQVSAEARAQVKAACLQSLSSPCIEASRAGAQAVAAIAFIEMPFQQWPDLLPKLNAEAARPDLAPELKISVVQAIGYICESAEPESIAEVQVNELLNTIGSTMNDNLPEKLYEAGTTAMLNTLEFAAHNMKNEMERNMIMNMIVQGTKSKYVSVRTKAYECIVKTASFYYEYLGEYITGIYESTFKAIREDVQPVGMQAIEFWTTLCEEEIYLLEEQLEQDMKGEEPSKTCAFYMRKCGKQLCELLLNDCLIKQEEDQDEETRNIATSAAMCLGFLSQCLHNDILPYILPFVEKNINNEDWHRREASVLAFGAMLEGPDSVHIQAPLQAAFETILSKMLVRYEANTQVRDTSAWCVSTICAHHLNLLIPDKHYHPLVDSLLKALDDEARVARNVAFAIHNFARAFAPFANDASNQLSPLFEKFIAKLLEVTKREDRNEWELADNAYEAINNLVENAAMDMHPLIQKLLIEIVKTLIATVETQPNTSDEKEEREKLQMFLCGNVQVIANKLQGAITQGSGFELPDKIMELMVKIIQIPNAPAHSDCYMVIGAMANAVDSEFNRYLGFVMKFVIAGLNNHAEYQVCQNAVGTVGDICRAVEGSIKPYCKEIMVTLANNLKDPNLNKAVKPPTLGVFGDIALAMGPDYEPYLNDSMEIIFSAAQADVDREDEDMVEYLNVLRESILEACTGIIQGLNGDPSANIPSKGQLLQPYAEPMLAFVGTIAQEVQQGNDLSAALVKGAVGVLGDLVFVLGQPVKEKILKHRSHVEPLFQECESSGDKAAVQVAQWSRQTCGLLAA